MTVTQNVHCILQVSYTGSISLLPDLTYIISMQITLQSPKLKKFNCIHFIEIMTQPATQKYRMATTLVTYIHDNSSYKSLLTEVLISSIVSFGNQTL